MTNKNLSKTFNKFVGQSIRNPFRQTDDADVVMDNLRKLAHDNGKFILLVSGVDNDKTINDNRVKVYFEHKANGLCSIKGIKLG